MGVIMTPSLRRDALRELLRAAGLDALLVTNIINVGYLTGFTGSNARLVVHAEDSSGAENRTRFFTDRDTPIKPPPKYPTYR
jgi:Xaa-Pro aminopeptidase